MRGLPLSRFAASLLAAGAVALAMAAGDPAHAASKMPTPAQADAGTDCEPDETAAKAAPASGDAAAPAAAQECADTEKPAAAANNGDAGIWTPEMMRSAEPLPTPKLSEEAFERMFGKDKTKTDTD